MWDIWETGYVNTGFWWGDLKERNHLKNAGINGRIILKYIIKYTGFVWLRNGTRGRRL